MKLYEGQTEKATLLRYGSYMLSFVALFFGIFYYFFIFQDTSTTLIKESISKFQSINHPISYEVKIKLESKGFDDTSLNPIISTFTGTSILNLSSGDRDIINGQIGAKLPSNDRGSVVQFKTIYRDKQLYASYDNFINDLVFKHPQSEWIKIPEKTGFYSNPVLSQIRNYISLSNLLTFSKILLSENIEIVNIQNKDGAISYTINLKPEQVLTLLNDKYSKNIITKDDIDLKNPSTIIISIKSDTHQLQSLTLKIPEFKLYIQSMYKNQSISNDLTLSFVSFSLDTSSKLASIPSQESIIDWNTFIKDSEVVIGDINAPVRMSQFALFGSPFVYYFINDTYPNIKKNYIDTNKIQFSYRPIEKQEYESNVPNYEVYLCGFEQNKGMEVAQALEKAMIRIRMNELFFTTFTKEEYMKMISNAKITGLDENKMLTCLSTHQYAEEIPRLMALSNSYIKDRSSLSSDFSSIYNFAEYHESYLTYDEAKPYLEKVINTTSPPHPLTPEQIKKNLDAKQLIKKQLFELEIQMLENYYKTKQFPKELTEYGYKKPYKINSLDFEYFYENPNMYELAITFSDGEKYSVGTDFFTETVERLQNKDEKISIQTQLFNLFGEINTMYEKDKIAPSSLQVQKIISTNKIDSSNLIYIRKSDTNFSIGYKFIDKESYGFTSRYL
ncbi:MAG: thioredoxin domain-containing protein [Candidatus Roizmanbacteria bacterium]